MKVYNVYSTITLIWNHEVLTNVIYLYVLLLHVSSIIKKELKNITSEYAIYLNGHKKFILRAKDYISHQSV